jgi:hypothetical protein
VITPLGNEINYSNRNADGGELDYDDIPVQVGEWVENIFFPSDGSAPNGTYTYYVVEYTQEGSTSDSWELQVLNLDEVLESQTGQGSSEQFTFEYNP